MKDHIWILGLAASPFAAWVLLAIAKRIARSIEDELPNGKIKHFLFTQRR